MQRLKLLFLGIAVTATVTLAGCAGQGVAAQTAAGPSDGRSQSFTASSQLAPDSDKDNPGKGGKDKGNDGNKPNNARQNGKGGNGKAEGNKAKAGNGAQGKNGPVAGPAPSGRGLGAWWRDFRAGLFGPSQVDDDKGGWQLGRFKDVFPFAYPPGWIVSERGDASLVRGEWQGREYVFQMSRTVQVQAESLEDWVSGDLERLGLTGANVRYAEAGRVQFAVVSGVDDDEYECPVAYVYLWTANPAGNNQRQARGIISQAPDAACDPASLNAFVGAYLEEVSDEREPAPAARPTMTPTATAVRPAASPTVTPGAGTGWQRTRFFNAFSFAYPQGWRMDRLGDTAHLQGEHQGLDYVVDVTWVRDAPQTGLEQWARTDLKDLGANPEGLRIDFTRQGHDTQIAIVGGVTLLGYRCPVVRMYVVADNAATGEQRAYTVTVAQANGDACNLGSLEDLAYSMVQ